MIFEWSAAKTAYNLRKHQVSFPEAVTAFGDPYSITIADPAHSMEEERCILLGRSVTSRILVVIHVERGETLRLISARLATRRERQTYEEEDRA